MTHHVGPVLSASETNNERVELPRTLTDGIKSSLLLLTSALLLLLSYSPGFIRFPPVFSSGFLNHGGFRRPPNVFRPASHPLQYNRRHQRSSRCPRQCQYIPIMKLFLFFSFLLSCVP